MPDSSTADENSPSERAARYRDLAQSIERTAGLALTEEGRTAYLAVAQQWRDLADELEPKRRKVTVCLDNPELAQLLDRSSS